MVMRSSMLRGSRMKVGRTTLLRSAPGLSWDMMCDRTGQLGQRMRAPSSTGNGASGRVLADRPFPCSGSTTSVSSSSGSVASPEDRLPGFAMPALALVDAATSRRVRSLASSPAPRPLNRCSCSECCVLNTRPRRAESRATHWHSRSPGGGRKQGPSSWSLGEQTRLFRCRLFR